MRRHELAGARGIVRGGDADWGVFASHPGLAPTFAALQGAFPGGLTLQFGGGPLLEHVELCLIFCGAFWADASALASGTTDAAARIISGSYMDGLAQYNEVGRGTLIVSRPFTSYGPPAGFTDAFVRDLILGGIQATALPDPARTPEALYCVLMPPGVVSNAGASIRGTHSFFGLGAGVNGHFAWICHDGTLPAITSVLSHELVEACTDPEGTGFRDSRSLGPNDPWIEIGDACEGTLGQVEGITVQAYWSRRDGACVVPGGTVV